MDCIASVNLQIIILSWKGSELMSKQSNQRYRKEVEKEQTKKAGLSLNASNSTKENQNKFNREFDSESTNR